ncbi:uncharacterized deoxyribonuclease YMR262W [[Candida] anglica]|uniref:Uncharacterized deoxyribonuclease YMR262W n=1 Tax=[Candida] anglica TaxID=148631 RepID=A0ABP0EAS8_9ASCO
MDLHSLSDSHCHVGIACTYSTSNEVIESLSKDSRLKNYALMSTNHIDIDYVDMISRSLEGVVVPFYGIHPWYVHLFYVGDGDEDEYIEMDHPNANSFKFAHYHKVLHPAPSDELLEVLPHPINLEVHNKKIQVLAINNNESQFVGIGEIGLDKPFRIPSNGYFGNQTVNIAESGPKLSNCRVTITHQRLVLESQLEIAQSLQLAVSLHCVKAHGALYDTVSKYNIPSIILHSFSGSSDQAKIWCKNFANKVFFSLSNWINGTESKLQMFSELLHVLGDMNILIETDLSIDSMDKDEYLGHLQGIFHKISNERGWTEQETEKILQDNWERCLRKHNN